MEIREFYKKWEFLFDEITSEGKLVLKTMDEIIELTKWDELPNEEKFVFAIELDEFLPIIDEMDNSIQSDWISFKNPRDLFIWKNTVSFIDEQMDIEEQHPIINKIKEGIEQRKSKGEILNFLNRWQMDLINHKKLFYMDKSLPRRKNRIEIFISNELEYWRTYIEPIEHSKQECTLEKLKWNGTPSQFGWLFLELANKGFIEIPQTAQQNSHSKYAKVCFDLFEIDTTLENLKNELNPKRNSLTYANREEFKIPYLTDITKGK